MPSVAAAMMSPARVAVEMAASAAATLLHDDDLGRPDTTTHFDVRGGGVTGPQAPAPAAGVWTTGGRCPVCGTAADVRPFWMRHPFMWMLVSAAVAAIVGQVALYVDGSLAAWLHDTEDGTCAGDEPVSRDTVTDNEDASASASPMSRQRTRAKHSALLLLGVQLGVNCVLLAAGLLLLPRALPWLQMLAAACLVRFLTSQPHLATHTARVVTDTLPPTLAQPLRQYVLPRLFPATQWQSSSSLYT